MNYIEEALIADLLSDQLYNEELLEQLDVEQDFMLSCLENNIILEAETPDNSNSKKGGWLSTIKETIKRVFNKFLEALAELVRNDEKWIKDNLPKIPNINFDGLSVTTLAYNTIDINKIRADLNTLQDAITQYKSSRRALNNLQTREQIENSRPFNSFNRNKNMAFADRIKIYFKTGDGTESKKITLSGNELKNMCVGEMSKYVAAYNTTISPAFKASYNNFTKLLDQVEKELQTVSNVKESFCVIENAYYADTELRLCSNYEAIFEAENDQSAQQQNNDAQKKEEPLNKIQNANKNDENQPKNANPVGDKIEKDANSQYYNYVKIAIQLNMVALTAAMTACEEKYRAYMSILRGVVAERGKK